MGSASSRISSTSLQKPQTYTQAAEVAKKLPDEILRLLFDSADFKDLLELSSISGCNRYVFTTAKTLSSFFTILQVEPKLKESGQIYFAPITRLIPGLTKETDDKERARIALRNNLCLKIAYYYVRIFQLYAALALSVMEANPTRTMSVKDIGKALAQAAPAAPQAAPFTAAPPVPPRMFGGAMPPRLVGGAMPPRLVGGAMPPAKTLADIRATNFALLIPYIVDADGNNLIFSPPTRTKTFRGAEQFENFDFRVVWNFSTAKSTNTLDAYFLLQGLTKYEKVSLNVDRDDKTATFTLEGTEVAKFTYDPDPPNPGWRSEYDRNGFLENLLNVCLKVAGPTAAAQAAQAAQVGPTAGQRAVLGAALAAPPYAPYAPARAPSSSSTSTSSVFQQLGTTSGKSAFERFDEVKKLFESRLRGDEFPKAYAVGRAMILLQPIFENEKTKETPFYSQVCRRAYDFESKDFLPRAGKIASANIYLKSLVALYYDDFKIVGTQPVFSQTETGSTELRVASQQIAKLFRVDKMQNTFVSSAQVQFAQYALCQGKGATDTILQINPKKDSKLVPTLHLIIAKLLSLQDEHSKKVNELLKKMFIVKDKTLTFSKELSKGGIDAVNKFAKEGRELLRQYYLKSEAFFTQGVLVLEDMQSELTALAIA